jgi:tRNA 2-thiocytidine biosynthesis protein TtcA
MSNRFLRSSNITKIITKLVVKAVYDYKLIEPNDKILLAASGGKDSTVLAMLLYNIKRELKINYDVTAVHVSSDFCACCKKIPLKLKLSSWETPFVDIDVPVIARLKEGRKMNCYWCSTQRRTELLKYAVENGINKIALGHHLDDILETFFMNLCAKGTTETMAPILRYDKYPVSLIRPLVYVEERQVIDCAKENDILKAVCTCPFGANSKRKSIRAKIDVFTEGSGAVKRRMLEGVLG